MSDVKWFKVLTDMFEDDKIKIIQSMPEGDSLLIMWFKVLSQAGKTNDGGYIYLKKTIPYTPSMLATLFGKNQQLVEMALRTFSEFGMIDIDNRGYIFVTNWEKHQNIEGMEKVKELTRKRVEKHRERKRIELEMPKSNVSSNVTVTLRNATDIDIDIDKESLKDIVDTGVSTRTSRPFIKPTIEEVTAYCLERDRGINANEWHDHYTANGWKVGKVPMKDWKAAVRTWEKNSKGKTKSNHPVKTDNVPSFDDWEKQQEEKLRKSRESRGIL